MVLQRLQKTSLHRCQLAKRLVSACPSATRVVSVISSVDFFAFTVCSLEEAEAVRARDNFARNSFHHNNDYGQ